MLHSQSKAINHVMGGCLYALRSPRRLCTLLSWQHLSEMLVFLGDSETAHSDHSVLCSLCLGTSGWDLQPLKSLEIPFGGWNVRLFLSLVLGLYLRRLSFSMSQPPHLSWEHPDWKRKQIQIEINSIASDSAAIISLLKEMDYKLGYFLVQYYPSY